MNDFSAWVKRTRQYHGMTFDELAKKADVTKSTIWEIESNNTDTRLITAKKIANALGCELWRALKNASEAAHD